MTDIRLTPAEQFERTHGFKLEYAPLGHRPAEPVEGLYSFVKERCAETGDELPAFADSLRLAELDAESWLIEHGYPEDVWDDDEWAWDDPEART